MNADLLGQAWVAHRASTGIDLIMRFSTEGLVLGAGTVLAPSRRSGRDISIDPAEPRLEALLTAAHRRRPAASDLAHLYKAAERRREGEDALASMHLVLSRLDRLRQAEEDAFRMFVADDLLRRGVGPGSIIVAIEAGGAAFEQLMKAYNPDQQRVPPGNGIFSGRWTTGEEGSPSSSASTAEAEAPVTPAAAMRHVGDDSCHLATRDCVYHAVRGPGGNANDNLRNDLDTFDCWAAGLLCEGMSRVVDVAPGVRGGAVIFPDRRAVSMKKGYEDVYLPSRSFPPVPR